VLLVLVLVAGASSLAGVLLGEQTWDALAVNLGTEMAGAVLTYALLELVVGGRQRRKAKERDLIVQFGSTVKDVAVAASEELRRYGWLYDGSLAGVKLENASLEGTDLFRASLGGVNLSRADLSEALLTAANLSEADLYWANLTRANLTAADLYRANLGGATLAAADLREANLREANLGGADLGGASLCQANLREAIVTGEQLAQAESLKGAIMPNGMRHG
jgi:hypothetical protein